jgi:hypothetical protein
MSALTLRAITINYLKKAGRLASHCNLGVEKVHCGGGAADKILPDGVAMLLDCSFIGRVLSSLYINEKIDPPARSYSRKSFRRRSSRPMFQQSRGRNRNTSVGQPSLLITRNGRFHCLQWLSSHVRF